MAASHSRVTIPAEGIQTIVWSDDALVDHTSGKRYQLDGTSSAQYYLLGYPFDAAIECNEFALLYSRLGTKAVLMQNCEFARELNRSYYFADRYLYPVAFFHHQDGRTVIAHCPEAFNALEFEDAETGAILTAAGSLGGGMFHSRLAVDPTNSTLMSAGWYWHPIGTVAFYDIATALTDSRKHDNSAPGPNSGLEGYFWPTAYEVISATFLANGDVLTLSKYDISEEEETPGAGFTDGTIVATRLSVSGQVVMRRRMEFAGDPILPLADDSIVLFYEHPVRVSLASGEIIEEWPDIKCGKQLGSIVSPDDLHPPLALDANKQRFAVAGGSHIDVVSFRVDPVSGNTSDEK